MLHFILLINLFIYASTVPWYKDKDFRLPRREGVTVGYTRTLNLIPQKTHTMKTLSMKPLIFEIKDFLTAEECEYLIYMAKHTGLKDSPTHPQIKEFQTTIEVFTQWDTNNDTFVEPIEFTYIEGKGDLYLTEFDVLDMMKNLEIDKNGDKKMDFPEFISVTAERIQLYFMQLYDIKPHLRSRFSKQAWLWHYGAYENLMDSYHSRLHQLTLIPTDLVEMSEPIQVVHYQHGGHYHCHHDSDEIDSSFPCCTYRTEHENCRQCRYLTIMFFLNNVTFGGETAFQLANNETFSMEAWEEESRILCNLADNCEKSNLIIQPLQGTALLWYNHNINEENGWIGSLDPMTYHGGCNVLNTDKWIANSWINVIGEKNTKESRDGWLGMTVDDMKREL